MTYFMRITYIFIALLLVHCKNSEEVKSATLFVGTYTDTDSEGIYRYQFDLNTGALTSKQNVAEIENPSYLKISPDKNYLYAVQETNTYDSAGTGGVTAYKINQGALEFLNSSSTGGAHPCHIGISSDGKKLAVSNYSGGNLAVFQTNADGSINADKQLIDHKVPDTARTSHVHSAVFNGDDLFAADLGLDAVKQYEVLFNNYTPALQQSSITLEKGDGPRHFTFSAEGKFLYVINEHSSTITVFQKNEEGEFLKIAHESTLSPDFKGDSYCADIHLSSDGKFLYGSNRGENSIVVFEVDQTTGKLSYVESVSVQGDWPRNFTIDPSGQFLLVANQKSDNISIFSRDGKTGTLKFSHEVSLPRPVCLEFL